MDIIQLADHIRSFSWAAESFADRLIFVVAIAAAIYILYKLRPQ